jgi:GNAT superfamily N-acetyltransferase
MSNRQLDEGPFDPDQIHVAFGHYHVLATGYDLFADPVLGYEGTDYRHGTPYGLIVPGAGPGLRIRTGHDGWITLNVVRRRREAVADLSAWDAVEQVTLQPAGQVRVADQLGEIQEHFPDLAGGRDAGYLAVRVSVRGRDQQVLTARAINPRRTPVEHHRIEAWPAPAASPRVVLKRDEFSRAWEASAGAPLTPSRSSRAENKVMLPVRRLTAEDIPAVTAITESLPDYFTSDVPAKAGQDAARHDGWVVADSDAVVGFAIAERKSAGGAEILWMAVDRAWRGRGQGTVLLRRVLADLAADGVSVVEVKTLDRSAGYAPYQATRAFWESRGFVQVDTIDPLPGWLPGNPAAIYVAALRPTAG